MGFFSQIETLDKSLDDLLTRVDEFVGMLDMVGMPLSKCTHPSRLVLLCRDGVVNYCLLCYSQFLDMYL